MPVVSKELNGHYQIKRRGTRSEYLVRDIFKKHGWVVIRSGGSLGPIDLVCIKNGTVVLVQVKSSKASYFYLRDQIPEKIMGFQVLIVADFGRGNIRVIPHEKKASMQEGVLLNHYLAQIPGSKTPSDTSTQNST